jgi:acyl carrier protein
VKSVDPISEQQALEMLEQAFDEPSGALRPDSLRENIPGWDSMGALALMAELDDRFNLALTAEKSKQMRLVSDILEYLREQGVLRP